MYRIALFSNQSKQNIIEELWQAPPKLQTQYFARLRTGHRPPGVSSSAARVNKIMFYFESFVIKSVKVAGKYIIYKDIQFPKLANISKVASVMKFLVSTEKGKALVNKDMHIILYCMVYV